MQAYAPPKFKPFTKTKVVLSIEPTPLEQKMDITATVQTKYRDPAGQGPDSDIKGYGAEVALSEGPQMFAKKGAKKKVADKVPGVIQPRKTVKEVPGSKAPAVYSRLDLISRDVQATEVGKLSQTLQDMAKGLLDIETSNPYKIDPVDTFVPLSRRGFGHFLVDQYGPIFPRSDVNPTGTDQMVDVAKCAAKGQEGVKEVKVYYYQAFIREYMRFESPYRGLLVYHGLGSGKTCSAIAAAEALFGTRGLKVIVMTPFSLRDNFISEINFCGFKHFRLQNHWTSLSLTPGSNPDPEMVKMFAKNVYGMPDSYFAKRGKGRTQLTKIWIPDFEADPNFDSLSAEDKDEIKTQLKTTIENRIKFINYNGITARELKTMVCSTPDIFDNAVIVVDEIHNLTRLIQGSLEAYFSNPAGRKRSIPLEVLTPERKKLPLCGMTKNYMRGYLFYRLFMDAKNTKVIGLSGTPLINFPEELGILSNILHGPMHTIEFTAKVEAQREIQPLIRKIIDKNENLDTVYFTVSEGSIDIVVTRLPEQFTKIFSDEGDIMGIKRRVPGKAIPTLEQIWLELKDELKGQKINISSSANNLFAKELLPSWDTPFRGAFLQEDGVTLKNVPVLQKRIRGLVSYYRGIQGDVMPSTTDQIVAVPLTGYSLKVYNKLRNQEIQVEMKKPKGGMSSGDAVWAEINEISTMKSASNYRMSSRQACNFAFPEGVSRPRPRNLEEDDAETGGDRDVIVDAEAEDGVAGKGDEVDAEDDAEVVAELKEKVAPIALGNKEAKAAYIAALKSAKDKLRSMGPTHLQLNGPGDRNLAKYSPKFAAMLKNINKLNGSSLVYSNFLEMEGIGIFGICMEANGYVPIEIVPGADGKLKFSERSVASLSKGPNDPEKRYIEFTGVGSKEQRGAAVDVFNARFDKLSPALQKVLTDAGWKNNFDGGLCRAFCITSAGAEGLSLKCVRGVHIMEPYWNTVRTQQVKGRAVRICSHMDLPKSQQNVSIFTYCTVIPEEALLAQAVDKTLENNDAYSAKDAITLGVPVPEKADPSKAIEPGLFTRVEQVEQAAEVQNEGTGPIRFFSKLDNEFRGFSNFAPSPVVIDGKRYPTVEHFFQASKYPSDITWQEAIRVSATPAKAKQLGTQKDKMDKVRPDWDSKKEEIMITGLRAKFQQNSGLLQQLKETGERPLIEASTDAFWGEGRTGSGKNRMGKLLEQVRTELKEFVAKPEVVPVPQVTEDFYAGDEEEAVAEPMAMAAPMPMPVPEVPVTAGNETNALIKEHYAALGQEVPEEYRDLGKKDNATREEEFKKAMAAPRVPQPFDEEIPQKGGADEVEEDRTIILTSDQKVMLISLRKEKVIGSLQALMKSVSIDCQLNFEDNKDGSYRCMALDDSISEFAYHPDLQKDIQETEARYKTRAPALAQAQVLAAPIVKPAGPKKTKRGGKEYFYDIKKDESGSPIAYLLYNTDDPKLERPIGYVKPHPETKIPTGAILPVPAEFL